MAKRKRTETIPSLALPYRAARTGVRLAGDALARYTSKIGTGAVGGAVRNVASNVKTVADYVAAGGRLKDVAGELASSTGAWAGHAARTGLAASFATEGVKSAARQGMKMLEDVGATGGFSKEGWKNLMSVEGVKDIGKGLVGSVMDVASGMTMGYLPNGDKVRDTMSVNRSPYETPVGVNQSPSDKPSVAGDVSDRLLGKYAEAKVAGAEARANLLDRGWTYWNRVELANRANADYADGKISEEKHDLIVGVAEERKNEVYGSGGSGDPGLAGYKSTFGLKGQTDEKPADQLNENIAKQNQQAKRSAEFNAYKTVTERQDAELSDVQKAANDLEKPGVSEANHALAKAKTNIELLQTEDKLQAQRDAAEIAQIMGDANEYATPEEDDRLQNPVDRFIAAGQRQQERETARDPLPQIEVDQINRETDALTQSVAQQQQQQPAQQQTTVQTAEDDAKKRSNGDQADEKGGDGDRFATSRNFLATDRVPDTIFGYPVVSRREDYTPEDLQFFKDHPEAGGYYDLGEGSPEDGTEEDPPDRGDQGADKGGASAGAPLHAAGPDADAARIESAIAEAVPFVKAHEGFRKDAYWDGIGKRWTVGYGQTEIADPLTGRVRPVREGDTVTEEAASAFVADRVRSDAARLHRDHPRWAADLSPGALAALYDISYNMGADALSARRSPTLNSELDSADMDFDSIVWQEVPTYVHAGGRKVKGLENRRNDAIKKWRRT